MNNNLPHTGIISNTFLFARSLARSISDMVDIPYAADNSSFEEKPFSSPFGMMAYIHFTGSIRGDYIISLEEITAADLTGLYQRNMSDKELQKNQGEYGEFIKELLNLATARAITKLEQSMGILTYTPPILVYGRIEFPAVLAGNLRMKGKCGEIICGFSLNLARQKINHKLEQSLDELEKKTYENREIREKLDNLLQKIPSGIVVVDSDCRILPGYSKSVKSLADQGKKQDIEGQNIEGQNIEGMKLTEILNLFPKDATSLENWVTMVFSYYHGFAFEKLLTMCENEFTGSNGRIFRLEWLPVLNLQTEKLENLQVMIEDISEKYRLESEIKEKEILKKQLHHIQKMELIASLSGGIAHDFMNILTIIMGNAEICRMKGPKQGLLPEKLKKILDACNIGKNIVDQLITISRQEETEFTVFPIEPVIIDTLSFLRSSLPSNIVIKQNIGSASANVNSDPTQIRQVLMNLCINASHAADKSGGIIVVSLYKINLEQGTLCKNLDLKPGDYIRLTVSDNGCGMSHETLERIFEPFFTTKEKGKGTGIGMSVIYTIVKNNKGAIWVHSEPGKGTTFHIFFPEFIKESESCKINTDRIPTGNERILITDDDPLTSYIAYENLSGLGYQVVSETDSTKALDLFALTPDKFDLVITDQVMPTMNGTELAEKINNIRPDIPILLCSGFDASLLSEEIKSKGIREFIMKPYSRSGMAVTIRKLLDKTGQSL